MVLNSCMSCLLQQTKLYLSRHIFLKDFYMKKNYRKNVVNYLKKNFKNCEYSIKYKENGLIPMFYNKFDNCNNFFKIGLYGNWIRSSTGYALQDSFENARNIAENFKSQKKIIIPKKTILSLMIFFVSLF